MIIILKIQRSHKDIIILSRLIYLIKKFDEFDCETNQLSSLCSHYPEDMRIFLLSDLPSR
ncbi:MAG TPA: hypothetical protein DIT04_04610 [Dysgonomonas sp.]|nr:hypothetical protein [Dysgonomonas sp.]